MWGALACQRFVVQKVADGFRRLTAQGPGAQIPMAEPPVKIDPFTVPMEVVPDDFDSTPISQTTATKVRVETSHRPRRSSKLQTLLAHPGDKEEPTDSSVTSSEPSTPEENPPSRPQTPGGIQNVTNALTAVVFVAVNAPAGADFSRSMEHDGKRYQKACRCHLTLPETCCVMQRQPPLSLILCRTRACQAAIPTQQDPVTSTLTSDNSVLG